MEAPISPIDPDRPEPRGMLVSDLVALIFGVALASALPTILAPGLVMGTSYGPVVGIDWAARVSNELAGKTALALALVAIGRRMSFGGDFRSGEWPIVVYGAAALASETNIGRLGLKMPAMGETLWYGSGTLLLALAASLLIAFPRQIPRLIAPWLRFALPVFWFGWPALFILYGLGKIYVHFDQSGGWTLLAYSCSFLGYMILTVPERLPVLLQIRDASRGRCRTWTWIEWAGPLVILWTEASNATSVITANIWSFPRESAPLVLLIWAGSIGLSLVLVWILIRLLGPWWHRWLGPGRVDAL